jgi:hypothetical protein
MRIRHLATLPQPADAASAVHATTRRWRAHKLLEVAMRFLLARQPLLACSTTAISRGHSLRREASRQGLGQEWPDGFDDA